MKQRNRTDYNNYTLEVRHVTRHLKYIKHEPQKEELHFDLRQDKRADRHIRLLGLDVPVCKSATCSARRPLCNCDHLCVYYGDCCIDAKPLKEFLEKEFQHINDTAPSSVQDESILFARHSACVELQVNHISYAIQVVTTCPDDVIVSE